VGEARNDFLIMAGLARRLGYGDLYPQSEEAVLRAALDGSVHTLESVRAAGGAVSLPPPMMEYRKWRTGRLRADGKPGFDTPTGKFEIHSMVLEDFGYEPLPHYTEPVEGPLAAPALAADFPLVFNSGARPHTDFRSQHHGIESLCRDNPEPTVTLNTDDAKARDILTGDLVEVRTPRGGVLFRARVTDAIVKGAVECNMGGGAPVGPAAWREWNVNELTDVGNCDEISGFPVYKALLCEVVRREPGAKASRRAATGRRMGGGEAFAPAPRRGAEHSVYLDNSATTRVAESVRRAMAPFLDDVHGNPSSIHAMGRQARDAVARARRQVAGLVGARPRRIVFTGGGSEADNLALKGAIPDGGGHIVTSAIEHPAVLQACRFQERRGCAVTIVEVDEDGLVRPEDLRRALRADTTLVSIMAANNEVGTLQPINELCATAHEAGALFHTDAVQAAGKVPIDVGDIDLLSLSGHKFHGPKGVGALYVRDGVNLEPLIHGGGQESCLRAGTENVAGIVGMGEAADLARQTLRSMDAVRRRRDRLEDGIRAQVPEARLNGHRERRLATVLNLTLPELRGESVVVAMDQRGVCLSSGSACKSGSPDPTHVLLAMGRSEAEAHCSVRFSLAHDTTDDHIKAAIAALADVLDEMRTTVRFLPCK